MRGLREDTPSYVGSVYLTTTGGALGVPAEVAWPNILTHNRVPGQVKTNRKGAPTLWTSRRGSGSEGDREIGRRITLVFTGMPFALWDALDELLAVDTARTTRLYHRFFRWDGSVKPDRTGPGALVAPQGDHLFVGNEATEVSVRLVVVSGAITANS